MKEQKELLELGRMLAIAGVRLMEIGAANGKAGSVSEAAPSPAVRRASSDLSVAALKMWRKRNGLSQLQTGKMIGITGWTVSRYEQGRKVSKEIEDKLAGLLKKGQASE